MLLLDRIQHQAHAVDSLRAAWERGRLAHAYLFWGPEGVGKMRTAQAVSQMVLCTASAPPCGECPACGKAARFTHPDQILVAPPPREGADAWHKALEAYGQDSYHCWQAAPNASIGIERIRGLKAESSMARVEKGNRMVIIREAERMTPEAAQAALKLIEEPGEGTYLVLTSRDPERLLPTILSRCQRLRFRPLPRAFIEERLAARDVPARVLAALAQGSLSRALAMLEEEDVDALRDRTIALFAPGLRSPAEVRAHLPRGRAWDAARAQISADLLMMWYEDLLLLHHGLPEELVTHADRLDDLRLRAQEISLPEIRRRCDIIEELLQAIRQNVGPLLALETALLRLNRLAGEKDLF